MTSAANPAGQRPTGLFRSFFLGGFECSTHRRRDGRRLDLLESTRHAELALSDYHALARLGVRSVRDGMRWHLIETSPGVYDWSSLLPQLRAAREAGVQVIWDVCHYGWPDDIDVWSPAFVERFARFAAAAAHVVRAESDDVPLYCPINEISYLSWAGADEGSINPCERDRGFELKQQLVRAAIAGIEAIRSVDARARIFCIEPVIHVLPRNAAEAAGAEAYRTSMFQAWDMMIGEVAPELGGRREYLDVLGMNYYDYNQWFSDGRTIRLGNPAYRPFRDIMADVHERYGRPLFIAETGAEGPRRDAWLRYMCEEAYAAVQAGVPIEGLCIYPVTDYPGWNNDRLCPTGLLGFADPSGERPVYAPWAAELASQTQRFDTLLGRAGPSGNGTQAA